MTWWYLDFASHSTWSFYPERKKVLLGSRARKKLLISNFKPGATHKRSTYSLCDSQPSHLGEHSLKRTMAARLAPRKTLLARALNDASHLFLPRHWTSTASSVGRLGFIRETRRRRGQENRYEDVEHDRQAPKELAAKLQSAL
jgi:hypothetical protein